ncbi:MAG: Chemotaxis phosphatase CheX [Polyangiaceae bacterium]|nr:Chemotaxis phosphatase CheX [Polyangiaceae bacterium]
MSVDKKVLVVDTASGALSFVMEELTELGFGVIWVPTLGAALEFMEAKPSLSLIIASSAATKVGGLDFLGRVRDLAPDTRIIWGATSDTPSGPVSGPHGPGPDSLIPEPFRTNELRAAISDLLAAHFYPKPIQEAVKRAALEVLGTMPGFEVEGGAFLVGNQTALSDLSAVIPFSGGVSGHLMVGITSESARKIYESLLPGVRPLRVDRMEDLVGELCNQILGRINVFFTERSVSIQHGTPIFIRAAGSTLRYPGRQPSFAVTLARGETRLSLEYYLSHFDREKLEAPVNTRVLRLGEIRYL